MTDNLPPQDDREARECNRIMQTAQPFVSPQEQIARIIDPRKWEVLDSYLAEDVRKTGASAYRGDRFKDKASLAKAAAILAAFANQERAPGVDEALRSAGVSAEQLQIALARVEAERDEAVNWSNLVDRHGTDNFDALADAWLAMEPIDKMHKAASSVFAKYADDKIMANFRQHMTSIMHTAFVEGCLVGVRAEIALAATPVADADDPTDGDWIERWQDLWEECPDARDTLDALKGRIERHMRWLALSASPAHVAVSDDVRKQIARVIEPHGNWDRQMTDDQCYENARVSALAKADAILALANRPATTGGGK